MEALKKPPPQVNGGPGNASTAPQQKGGKEASSGQAAAASGPSSMAFMYTHQGRSLESDMTVEEAGIEDADEILAVELMDLTGPMPDDAVSHSQFVMFSD